MCSRTIRKCNRGARRMTRASSGSRCANAWRENSALTGEVWSAAARNELLLWLTEAIASGGWKKMRARQKQFLPRQTHACLRSKAAASLSPPHSRRSLPLLRRRVGNDQLLPGPDDVFSAELV